MPGRLLSQPDTSVIQFRWTGGIHAADTRQWRGCARRADAYTSALRSREPKALLNRIYIVVGLLAIVLLAAAFVVPRFIQWSDYRDRMEVLASEVLGADVSILGDIEFTLLPQPRLRFSEVVVGNLEAPAVMVEAVDAQFSLIEFLRDQYTLTRMVLTEPRLEFTVDENGLLGSGVSVADGTGAATVSLERAQIIDGQIRLTDVRAGENFVVDDLDGEVRLSAFTGPLQFQGSGVHEGQRYSVNFNTSAMDAEGSNRLAAYVESEGGSLSLSAEGLFTAGVAPRFDGEMTMRRTPPEATAAANIQGDLVFESPIEANTDRVVLAGYTLLPDENQPGTRLTGAASIQLGARASFDAVVSGGVFALPPRDATEDQSGQPYELVRLLRELPAPSLPPLPGRIGMDLAEMDLRAFSFRDVRLDAETDGETWTVDQFVASLPGNTRVRASGSLTVEGQRPGFTGEVTVVAQRLDSLVQLWRRASEDNPLFNLPGSYRSQVILGTDALAFTDGTFTLNGQAHKADLRIGYGEESRLDVMAQFGELSAADSQALAAMVPDISVDPQFNLSFPQGSFSLKAAKATVMGLPGEELALEGEWSGSGIVLERVAAAGYGGAGFDAVLNLQGTLTDPVVWGSGTVEVTDTEAPALTALYDWLKTPQSWRRALSRSLPVSLTFEAAQVDAEGRQDVRVDGTAGVADVDFAAQLGAGLAQSLTSPLAARLFLESDDADALSRQLGFGDEPVFAGTDGLFAAVNFSGTPANSLEAQVNLSSGEETIGFAGNLVSSGSEIDGTGTLDVNLADAGGLGAVFGGRQLSLPQVEATAEVHFRGTQLLRLTGIDGTSGDAGFSGELSASRTGATTQVAGAIALERANVAGLGTVLFGRAGLVEAGDGAWPIGPVVVDEAAWQTRGAVTVTAPTVALAGEPWLQDAAFELTWNDSRLRLSGFSAKAGEGRLTADVTICCADRLTEKTVSGRATLSNVALAEVLPPVIAASIGGTVTGGVQFEGTGGDLETIAGRLAGEGSFSVTGLTVANMTPRVYETVGNLDNILEMEADALETIIALTLDQGPFEAPEARGAFTIAGGVARLANLSFEGEEARLAGGIDVMLDTLALDGAFTLTPLGFDDPGDLISQDTARIVSRISGTLLDPQRTLDLSTMVAAVQVRANELEVERLEALRLADEARQRAAAEARNKLVEEQMRQRAAEEAERAAAEEAARRAAEGEAVRQQQQAEEEEQQEVPEQPLTLQPGFQPGVGPLFESPLDIPPPTIDQSSFFVPLD